MSGLRQTFKWTGIVRPGLDSGFLPRDAFGLFQSIPYNFQSFMRNNILGPISVERRTWSSSGIDSPGLRPESKLP
jgi:hypothetical protein